MYIFEKKNWRNLQKKLIKCEEGTKELPKKYSENWKKVLVLSNIRWNFEKKN